MTPHPDRDETNVPPLRREADGVRGGRYGPAAAAIAVAFIVGIASRGVPVWTELSDGAAERALAMESVLRIGMVGLTIALAATLLIHHLLIARRPGAPPLRTTLARAAPLTLLSLALLSLIVLSALGTPPERQGGGAMQLDWFPGLGLASDPVATPGAFADATPPLDQGIPPPPDPPARSLLPLIAALIVLAAFLALVRRWRPRRPRRGAVAPIALHEDQSEDPTPERMLAGLRESIEAMLIDPDPRTSVIGAYARLLVALDAGPGARLPFEAPREHLRRAMAVHDFPTEPSRVLIGLFELARYSRHPLSEAHRAAALAALRGVLTAIEASDRGTAAASVGAGAC